MGHAYKCDRCGKYFDSRPARPAFDVLDNSYITGGYGKHVDLCPDCQGHLDDIVDAFVNRTCDYVKVSDSPSASDPVINF